MRSRTSIRPAGCSTSAAAIATQLITAVTAGTQNVKATALSTTGLYIEAGDSQTTIACTSTGSDTPGNQVFATLVVQGEAIPFGRAVCWDIYGDANSCRLPQIVGDVASGVIFGVSFADTSIQTGVAATVGQYFNNSAVPIVHKGRVWVTCDSAVTAVGTQAYVRYASGSAGTNLGGFNTGTDTSTCASLTGARFVSLCTRFS